MLLYLDHSTVLEAECTFLGISNAGKEARPILEVTQFLKLKQNKIYIKIHDFSFVYSWGQTEQWVSTELMKL